MEAVSLQPPPRGLGFGYNHSFRYLGRVFHVQTEDSGERHPHIYTHVFCSGTVVATRKTDYRADNPDRFCDVRGLMQRSHKAMCRALARGDLDEDIRRRVGPLDLVARAVEPSDETAAPLADDPAPRASPQLEVLRELESDVRGLLGAALLDRDAGAICSLGALDVLPAAEEIGLLLDSTARNVLRPDGSNTLEDLLITLEHHYFILHPVAHHRYLFVAAERAASSLGLVRHCVAATAARLAD